MSTSRCSYGAVVAVDDAWQMTAPRLPVSVTVTVRNLCNLRIVADAGGSQLVHK